MACTGCERRRAAIKKAAKRLVRKPKPPAKPAQPKPPCFVL